MITAICDGESIMPRVSTKSPDAPTLEVVTTRIPVRTQSHSKVLAAKSYQTLTDMQVAMLDRFLLEKPWENGLRWHETKALTGRDDEMPGHIRTTGWIQTNFRLTPDMRMKIEDLAEEVGQSVSTVLHTATAWWVWLVFPPKFEAEKREEVGIVRSERATTGNNSAA